MTTSHRKATLNPKAGLGRAAVGLWAVVATFPGIAGLGAAILPAERPISGRYIVVLTADAGGTQSGGALATAALGAQMAGQVGGHAGRVFTRALHGFTFAGSAGAAESLARDPRVAYVAEDGVVTLSAVQTPTPSWGLDRIDQREATLDSSFAYESDGAGVDIYVVDSGIRSTHEDFGGRVDTVNAFTAIDDGWGTEDCNGHGTVVAGVAGAESFGVAKGATLHPVRVVGCDGIGSVSATIAGVDWITGRQQSAGARRAVANISLNNSFSFPLEEAVERALAAGVVFVVAAGNDGADAACYLSPQRLPGVITVGASDESGARWAGSNYGGCLDLYAPGTGIVSTFIGSDSATVAMTGTSVAAPHVAGTAALVLADHPEATPDEVQAMILAAATPGAVADAGEGTPDRLLFAEVSGPVSGSPLLLNDGFESGDTTAWSSDLP